MSVSLVVIAHNIRSSHNVGALLRTCEGLGIETVYLTGYTPYPFSPEDKRLPHIAKKVDSQIQKTALGAEKTQKWYHCEQISEVLKKLKSEGYAIGGLEQSPSSVALNKFKPPSKLCLVLGSEVTGIDSELIEQLDVIVEIPMKGKKESFNVVEAASMALYHCSLVNMV